MVLVTTQDTDGNKGTLLKGELGLDAYKAGGDYGRLWVGDGDKNNPVAFLHDIAFKELLSHDIYKETASTIGRVAYATDLEAFVYYKDSTRRWYTFSAAIGDTVTIPGEGTGLPGVVTTTFEEANLSDTIFTGDFGDSDNGSVPGKLNRHTGGTTSPGTGPSAAYVGDWYLYLEASKGGHSEICNLTTTKFKRLTSVEFSYHLNGNACGTLQVITTSGGVQSTVWEVSDSQGDQWNTVHLDVASSGAEELTFTYSGATGWQADMALDNIIITSE